MTAVLLAGFRSKFEERAADIEAAEGLLEDAGARVALLRGEGLEELLEGLRSKAPEADVVLIAGGDGTLNAAAPALIETGSTLAVLPLGTANDLARTLGLSGQAIEVAVGVALNGREVALDLGEVNGVFFFNVASLGLGAKVARRLTGDAKRRWGIFSYPATLLAVWRARRSFEVHLRCDGRKSRLRTIHVAVGNGRYYGGGMVVAPDAQINDGQLVVTSIAPQSLLRLLLLGSALHLGLTGGLGGVVQNRGSKVEIETGSPMGIDTDGEIRAHTPAKFSLRRKALRVRVPADSEIIDSSEEQ